MEASKSLRRPINWQDFETLCKKLWGEIWHCPEIKKNGRPGQNQKGVDICGIPQGESGYYGIQCKGKDEYTDKQFTEKEINTEIENAKHFEPALRKLYFATTAVKDAGIEAYIRKKNLEHIAEGLFEIHLFSWEDIVDLIDENRQTHDWYVNNQNYKGIKNVSLTFDDDSTEKVVNVRFKQSVIDYRLLGEDFFGKQALSSNPKLIVPFNNPWEGKINHSYYSFYFKLHNLGELPIEDFKVLFWIEGEFLDLKRYRNWSGIVPPKVPIPYDTFIDDDKLKGTIVPKKRILVSEEVIGFDDLGIKPAYEGSELVIKWKLISKDYKATGNLKLNISASIEIKKSIQFVQDRLQVREERGEIEDLVENAK